MKNIFNSKIVLIISALLVYTVYSDFRGKEGIKLTENQQNQVIEAVIALALGGFGIYGRYKGDSDMYTPKGIPGRDKDEEIVLGNGDDISIK